MKIIEQVCTKCGKVVEIGSTACLGCGAEIAQYDKASTYRFMSTASAKNEHETAMLFAKKHGAEFLGKSDIGYWIAGPVEARV